MKPLAELTAAWGANAQMTADDAKNAEDLGMAWRSLLPLPAAAVPGVRLAQRPVLRWAVAGLGFRLSLGELWSIGGPALVVVVLSTFAAQSWPPEASGRSCSHSHRRPAPAGRRCRPSGSARPASSV